MKITLSQLLGRLRNLLCFEEGQDLIEYALIVSLIAFGATASISLLASEVGTLFSSINFHMTV